MAVQTHLKTYSLYDLKIATLTGDTPGTLVDVPGIQELTVTIATEGVELRGDNMVIAAVDKGNSVEWKMTAGGLSLATMQIIFGQTYTDTGVTPAVVRRLDIAASTPRPYFVIVGHTLSDDGTQDLDVIVWKAKATGNVELTFKDEEFITPGFEGVGVAPTGGANSGKPISFIQHETGTASATLPA